MHADRREAWRAAEVRVTACRERVAALEAGRVITAADLARAWQQLALARERAERARLALQESRARHYGYRTGTLTGAAFSDWLGGHGTSLADVMVYYLSIGGVCSSFELDAFANNALVLPDVELAVLRHALWEMDEFHGSI
jgi:hypothetical protein